MRSVRRAGVLALSASLLVACVGLPPERPPAPSLRSPVDLDVLLPLSGEHEARGRVQWGVVELAVRRLNESRGPLDRRLRARIHDCGSTSADARALIERLQSAGTKAVVGPHSSPSAVGLQDFLDLDAMLVVLPDARDLPADVGGPSSVFILPPDAARGVALVEAGAAAGATSVTLTKPPGAATSDPAEAATTRARTLGMTVGITGGDLRLVQDAAEAPRDLLADIRGRRLVARRAAMVWTDPALTRDALVAGDATPSTYDAVIALGRVLRRAPDDDARALRRALTSDRWTGSLGPVRPARSVSRTWVAHPPIVGPP